MLLCNFAVAPLVGVWIEIQKIIVDKIHALENQKESIDLLISNQLQPQLSEFENKLDQQLNMMLLIGELDVVRQNETQYKSELFNKETEQISEISKHNIYDDYGYDIILGFEEKLKQILLASKIGGASSARLNMENFDVVIGGL